MRLLYMCVVHVRALYKYVVCACVVYVCCTCAFGVYVCCTCACIVHVHALHARVRCMYVRSYVEGTISYVIIILVYLNCELLAGESLLKWEVGYVYKL